MNYFIFLVTVPNIEEGQKIAKILVETKLAACVNIIQNIISIYRWKGKIEEDNEHLLLIKTTEENSNKIIQKVKEIHSYTEPECIGLKIEKGSETYLKWIKEVVE
ncbi:MAG: divalent-cation tolerance protein CutA [Candidatus Lokiarchaeota archaeon]|nr:divalent-cation tolerance protein CutA [Candidatus Lokiarchaeota archaeon]